MIKYRYYLCLATATHAGYTIIIIIIYNIFVFVVDSNERALFIFVSMAD